MPAAGGPGAAGELPWDGLVLAIGAVPRRLAGSDGGAHVLRTLADAHRLRSALVPGARVVVVGAGWIGAEVATVAARRGCSVTVLEAATAAAGRLARAGRRVPDRHWYAAAGVELRTGAAVPSVDSRGVRLAGEGRVDADVVVEAVGVRPRPRLAGRLRGGRRRGQRRGGGRRGLPQLAARRARARRLRGPLVAAGPLPGPHRALGRRAARAEVAAATLLGEPAAYDPVPYVWSEQFGRYVQWVGWRTDDRPAVWRGDPAAGTGWSAAWLARTAG